MKRQISFIIIFMLSLTAALAAQEALGGRQIENTLAAVKAARPGDYIVSPTGKKYVLTGEEIAIARGEFDYGDLSKVETTPLADGSEIKTLSKAHRVHVYPDGQAIHEIKTERSFSAYMKDVVKSKYKPSEYIDIFGDRYDARPLDPPGFGVFRAIVQFQTISDGVNKAQRVTVTAYNYKGDSFEQRYYNEYGFIWGYVSSAESYKPVGDPHKTEEFELE